MIRETTKFLRGLGWVISLLSVLYVAWQLYSLPSGWDLIWDPRMLLGIGAALLLGGLQLAVETHKWRRLLLIREVNVSFREAFRAVLAGFSAGAITPNRIGEYAGRLLVIGEQRGSVVISQTVLDRLSQSVPTWLAGIWLGWELLGTAEMRIGIFMGVLLASIIVLTAAWYLGDGLPWMGQLKVFLRKVWNELISSPVRAWGGSIFWSCVRYSIFVVQFVVLAKSAGIAASTVAISAFISTVFWIKSLMPFIGFSELGVRESIAVSLAAQHGWEPAPVVVATFALYAINNLLPTLAGAWIIRNPS